MANISIIGGGSWGLAMTHLLKKNHHNIRVWEYNSENVQKLQNERANEVYLKGVVFDEDIIFTSDIKEAVNKDTEILVFAIPSVYMRQTVKMLTPPLAPPINVVGVLPPTSTEANSGTTWGKLQAVVSLVKGLEEGSLKRMSEVLTEELPSYLKDKICSLSGPSHAEEVAKSIPTLVVVAGKNHNTLEYVQKMFSNQVFRVYASKDIVGVEIGAAVKNIISIAAGVVSGLGYGDNTMGALLTRGLAEIKRLGLALNADPETFSGLSGLGDLVTTAISPHSRNRYVGFQLGKGKKLEEITKEMVMIAEGVITTKNIRDLKEKLNITMPITEEMYQLLYKGKDPKKALSDLMRRELKSSEM